MRQFKMNERQRFSIRKFSIGAASVLLGSVFFVANPATEVQAAEAQSNVEIVNDSNENSETSKSGSQSSNGIVAPVDNTNQPQSAGQGNTVKTENTKEQGLSGEMENREAEKTKVALNTKNLEDLLSEIDKLELADYTEKSVKVLQEKVAKAKEVLVSATTQKEIVSAYNALVGYKNSGLKRVPKLEENNTPKPDTTGGKETVGKKAENTEPNSTNIVGHNHSLNGTTRAAGSGFRDARQPELTDVQIGRWNGTRKKFDSSTLFVNPGGLGLAGNNMQIKAISSSDPITDISVTGDDGLGLKKTKGGLNTKEATLSFTGNTPNKGSWILTVTVTTAKGTKTATFGYATPTPTPTITTSEDNLKGKSEDKPEVDVTLNEIPNLTLPDGIKMKVYLIRGGGDSKDYGYTDSGAYPYGYNILATTEVKSDGTAKITSNDYVVSKIGEGEVRAITVYELPNTGPDKDAGERGSFRSAPKLVTKATPKEATPVAPTVTANESNANVTVTPSANADKVEISIGTDKVVATKTGSTWTLSPAKAGVSIDGASGVVTISHEAAAAGTSITATAKHGNSEASSSASATLPAKEATPGVPTVTSDTENARVTVTPSANADHVEISIGTDKVVATKTGTTWTLSPAKAGVSIDGASGVVTISHEAAAAGTSITATAKHGNSEASDSSVAVNLPVRRYYPIPDSYNATPQPSTPTQPDQGGTETPTTPSAPAPQPSQPTAPGQSASPAPVPSSAPTQAPRVGASASASSTSTQAPAPAQEQVDKSELRALSQELDQRLKVLTTVSDAKIDTAKAVLLDAQKALEDSTLTEQGLRTAVESVKAALDSLKDVKANASDSKPAQDKKDAKQGTEDSKDSDKMTETNSVPAGVIVVSLLALLSVIAFWLVRRKKGSEIQQLSTELAKVLGQLDAEKADKKVLAKAKKLLQETLDFVKEENGSAETEAKLAEELKAILAKLK